MDITSVIQAIIGLLAAVMAAFVVPFVKSKTTAAQRQDILDWVNIAVAAAEQLYKGGGSGAAKKSYVLSFLAAKGFNVDENAVEAMIEAAVFELKNMVV